MNYKFRDLTANEIECRIAQIKANGLSLLLYKDARCDMKILDETVGAENWERDHKELKSNIYCGISIYDEIKNSWVTKWDCGAESYTEKEKGEASDSFKRAGFNWGIGRELYSSPFIWIPSAKCNIADSNGKKVCYDKFEVSYIEIKNKEIVALKIINKTSGIECFNWNKNGQIRQEIAKDEIVSDEQAKLIYKALVKKLESNEAVVEYLIKKYEVDNTSKLMKSQYVEIINDFKNK